ncbi:zinc-ribbon domain-containing protein [Cellulophaga sp. HaHaR_3_176]|uniref:zinc-ribbon domain-containing protein n=1 Tax=Cellulophaga sp. HaHaR_3_176 TaxID=1942464 RepID=UPI001C1FA14B|nr:zinc-ribbon domain-containing protein [Cellulophaga sp. HaHaR_3_176]QWX85461.1 zinc-ribbon domain-containing protein [Cellulophaga sp. HaHaR_3_176]
MIFYGTKGSHLFSERKNGIKCDNCNEITAHNISVYGKYAYIYWIPFFPMSKKAFSECTNCSATLDVNGMNGKLKSAATEVKNNTKTPIWYWSGLAIIAVLISLGVYSSLQHDKDVAVYINQPAVGDVIEFKSSENGYYSTLKISAVTSDSIFVIQNDYETDKKTGVSDIDKASNYTTEPYSLGKNQIQGLFDEKVFYDINR